MRTPRDWGQPCSNPDCSLYNLMHKGNVSAISTSMTHSGKPRILRTLEEEVMLALKMLLVRVDVAGIRFVLGVTEETVLEWLARAAHNAQEINAHMLRELPVTQVQLDEIQRRARMVGRGLGCALLPSSA